MPFLSGTICTRVPEPCSSASQSAMSAHASQSACCIRAAVELVDMWPLHWPPAPASMVRERVVLTAVVADAPLDEQPAELSAVTAVVAADLERQQSALLESGAEASRFNATPIMPGQWTA